MNHLLVRIWAMATITPAVAAVILRMLYETTKATAAGTWIIIILLIFVILSIYSILLYLAINPDMKKLKTPLVKTGLLLVATAALISGIIHFARFVLSSAANLPISIPMAILLLTAGINAYILLMFVLCKTKSGR